MHENGNGCAVDYSKAMKYFQLGADKGYAKTQINLGLSYLSYNVIDFLFF